MKKLTIAFLFFVLTFQLKGQPCFDFHKPYLVNKMVGCGVKNISGYKLFSQSRSSIVEAGITYKYQVTIFGGYDYKIGLCTKKDFSPIHFRILNTEDQSVIYDNLGDKYAETVGFSNEKTKNVIFEITLLATKKKFNDIGDNRTCLGVAIYWCKIPKMGL